MLVNKSTITRLHTAFSSIFYNALSGALAESSFGLVAQEVPSSTSEAEYGWIRAVPDLEEEIGEKRVHDLAAAEYTIKNKAFSNLIRVKRDHLADDNIGVYESGFKAAGQKAGVWLGKQVLKLLPLGTTSKGKCFDKKPFFSASHPNLKGGTYSNYLPNDDSGNPWYLIDTRQALKPLVHQRREGLRFYIKDMPKDENVFWDEDVIWKWRRRSGFGYTLPQFAFCSRETLNEAGLEKAVEAMSSMTDDLGDELDIQPNLLVVGPKNLHKAKRLLAAEFSGGGNSNIHHGSMRLVSSAFVEKIPS